jgi:septal ring factor EnvC (AmiA/AmiB activator)
VREPSASYLDSHASYVPVEFQHDFDVAECALDEQLEHLQRQYASAVRAASRARYELELLETRSDVHPHVLAQVKRQRAAAETRSARLIRAIDALEERLENE